MTEPASDEESTRQQVDTINLQVDALLSCQGLGVRRRKYPLSSQWGGGSVTSCTGRHSRRWQFGWCWSGGLIHDTCRSEWHLLFPVGRSWISLGVSHQGVICVSRSVIPEGWDVFLVGHYYAHQLKSPRQASSATGSQILESSAIGLWWHIVQPPSEGITALDLV